MAGTKWRFFLWTMLALLLAVCVARAAGPEDDYVTIYGIINDADHLSQNGKTAQAHDKYLEAWRELNALQKANPNWNTQIVAYRLNDLAEKITAAEKPQVPATSEMPAAKANAATAPAKKSAVKLLDAGSEPRTVLRLHPSAGDKQTLSMTMKMAMDMSMAGKATPSVDIPAIVMTMLVEVKNIATNGDISYEITYDDATVAEDTNTPPVVAAALKTSLASIRGMSGTGRLSSQGIPLAMQMKMPPAADPQMVQVMNQMKDSFSSSTLPLPEQAVGPGAKWEYQTRLKSQGMSIDQTITSELVSVDGDHVTLNNTITQSAANQKIQNPAMPGLKIDLARMTGNATGKSVLDLSRLLPASATLDANTETSMSFNVGQQKQSMDMKMNINVSIESK